MPTVNVTIPSPIIVAPAVFRVRYRDINAPGAPVWTLLPDQTNAPFSFTVPVIGEYVLGIVYVSPEGEPCAEYYQPFSVVEPCACIVVTEAAVRRLVPGGQAYLQLTYTNAAGAAPACGVTIKFKEVGLAASKPPIVIKLNPMPNSPISIPVKQTVPLNVEVILDCCDCNPQVCYTGIAYGQEPLAPCEAVSSGNTVLEIVKSVSTGQYSLRLTFPGPTPPTLCETMTLGANQINVSFDSLVPADRIMLRLSARGFAAYGLTGWRMWLPLNPGNPEPYKAIAYDVVLHDCCGNAVYFPAVAFTGTEIA